MEYTLNEIARENNIPPKEAITKFLSDVEYQYDYKLGFEFKIESLQKEVNKLNQEHARLHSEILLSPLVGPKLVKLTQSGVTEQDIINIAAVFEKYIAGKDRQSFVSELEVYGSLKSAIQELSKQSDKMRMEVGTLQTQNRNLNADNQRIVSSIVNLRYGLGFMQDYANSLRNDYLEKFKSNNGDEFALLNRAYKGEGVSAKEIRKELIITIKNMENKLE